MLPAGVPLRKASLVAPKLMKFPAILMEKMILSDGSRGIRPSNTCKPRALRWLNAKQAANKSLVELIDKKEGF